MDFKGWKKISEDGKSATLVHPKGHQMLIAVKALPKILQEQIKRLDFAEGGDVLDSGEGGKSTQGQIVREAKKNPEVSKENYKQAKDEARGRAKLEKHVKPKIKGLAEGGEVPVSMPDPEKARQAWQGAQNGQSLSSGWQNLKNEIGLGDKDKKQDQRKGYAGSDDPADSVVSDPSATAPPQAPININVGAQPAQAQAPVQNPPVAMPVPQAAPIKDTLPIDRTLIRPDNTPDLPQSYKEEKEAGMRQAEIDAAQSRGAAEAVQENLERRQKLLELQQRHFSDLSQHADDLQADLKNIDPKHYQESMGSGQKVATAVGLALGGFGTAFGGHNYAMDFLNKQIDRDIDAQKTNNENKKTIWGAYKDLYGDSVVADGMTKVALIDRMDGQIKLAALKQGTPQAWANYQKMAADNAFKRNEELVKASGRLGQLSLGGGSGQSPQGKGQMDKWHEDHVLSPNADQISRRLMYDPTAEKYLPQIMEQKAKADLSDKALSTVNNIFPNMPGETSEAGYARSKLEPFLNGIPLAGNSLAKASNAFTDTKKTRNYDVDRSAIVGAIRGALQGNVSDELLDSTVSANLPELHDSPEILEKKKRTLKEFIKSHTKTDMLRTYGLSKE